MDLLETFFARGGFLPHGYCFTWRPGLLWTMVGSDSLIALAYFSIPLALLSFARRRAETRINRVMAMFAAFIFSCGVTHVMDIWTIWRPDYGLQALSKAVAAAISVGTAIALWRLIPAALRLPTVTQLQDVIASMQSEVELRRGAESRLSELQRNLAVTLATIDAGFLAADRQGRVTELNEVGQRIMGWSRAEAVGRSFWDVYKREGMPPEFASMSPAEVMAQQSPDAGVAHYRVAISRDNVRTPIEVKGSPTYSDDGQLLGMAMVFRDITALEQAQTASNRLAAIVESSNDAIIGKTLDGRITDWNAGAQAMFGYTPDEAIGQSIQMLVPADREAEEAQILVDLAQGRRVPSFDTVRKRNDGSLIDVSVAISPIRDLQGRIVGAAKIARDVTPQRRAETERLDRASRLRFALESAQIGDWELDLVTGGTRRSLLHDRCFGYTALQATWSYEIFEQHLHPDDRIEVRRQFLHTIASGADWHTEFRVVWPDNGIHWISLHGTLQHDAMQPARMLGIITDVTRQKLAEEARQQAILLEAENVKIREASRTKSLFLANMSHELRTPLNAIIGFADLLQSGAVGPDSPKRAVFLGHIANSGRHLLTLINDVLDLAKVESGKFEFFPEPLHLPTLITEVTDILHTAILRKRLRVEHDVTPEVADLHLDPSRLKQVLYNYLSNAIKFTAEGGVVTIRAQAEGPARFRLEVQDTGIGIAAEDLPRLFTEFQQLESGYSKQHQGTGLGLALTRRLVESQGGRVGVRSTPGVGSVFHLVMNRIHGTDPVVPERSDDHPAISQFKPRILVLQKGRPLQERFRSSLVAAGYDVEIASNRDEAVGAARQKSFDAIALDLLPADGGGLDVLAQIRGSAMNRQAPVTAISMDGGDSTSVTFAIADILVKPLRVDEIRAAMTRLRVVAPVGNVLVIVSDLSSADMMRATLKGLGIEAVCVNDGHFALRDIDIHRPDAIILDLLLPGAGAFELIDALSRLAAWRLTPIFVWTATRLTSAQYQMLGEGAKAIVGKGGGSAEDALETMTRLRHGSPLEDNSRLA